MNRKFELTPAGEHFYKKSLVIVADYDRLVQDTIRISRKDHAELRIGYLKSYAGHAIQTAVAYFSEKYPDASVHIVGGSHEDLKNTPCILVTSKNQQKTEADYYSDIFGFQGDFLFGESVDEAQLMVVQYKARILIREFHSSTVSNDFRCSLHNCR